METQQPYQPKNKIRIVTAASLFDGHDAAINIMRRIIQATGVEVIHLGHDRSVAEIVETAIQEDAQAIALTSYQGGHNEFFKYMYDLLQERGCGHIKIFGGGGGTILPSEIEELEKYGITKIYSPDDGRKLGLQGMINDLVKQSDFSPLQPPPLGEANGQPSLINQNGEIISLLKKKDERLIAQLITIAETDPKLFEAIHVKIKAQTNSSPVGGGREGAVPVLGITGTGGAGKSSLVDELVRRFLLDFSDKTIGIVSVDPSKRKTGGALLGDRIRMNAIRNPRVYMRSLATRQSNLALSKHVKEAVDILKAAEFDLIILETSGIGQSDTEILDYSDVSLYVMTPEYGAATQLEKIDMLDFADIIALNKFDKRGSLDALRDVKKQYRRNHQLFEADEEQLPVFGTIASQFNDPGMNRLYKVVMDRIAEKTGASLKSDFHITNEMSEKVYIIPPARNRYLSEIAETVRKYNDWSDEQSKLAQQLYGISQTVLLLGGQDLLGYDIYNYPPLPPLEKGGSSSPNQNISVSKINSPNSPPLQGGVGGGSDNVIENYTGRLKGNISNHPALKTFRRELRNNLTPAEAKLWSLINNRQLHGRKFRRQHSVGPYILDFYCPEEKLAIELDGEGHFNLSAEEYDKERSEFLNTYGILVLRFENKEVFEQTEGLLEEIKQSFGRLSNTPPAPPQRGGELNAPNQNITISEINSPNSPPFQGGAGGGLISQELEGDLIKILIQKFQELQKELHPRNWELIKSWKEKAQRYKDEYYIFKVRDKEIKIKTHTESLSHTQVPKVSTPRYTAWGDLLRWCLQENIPGEFPYTAGIYPFKREGEDPTRMFAGEGGPERTNKRFHYLSKSTPAKRLSTAFDSVTLYGNNPDHRPDIYGKVGNSGVSICCLDDAKKLYSGFNLCNPSTSVSMTINGPAPMLLGFFLNAAIDQQCEIYIQQNGMEAEVKKKITDFYKKKNTTQPKYNAEIPAGNDGLGLMLLGVTGDQILPKVIYEKIKVETLMQVRGTVQADILKEDQAQNTCIFSTEFALRMMGDVQQYFITNKVRNFYSVSISGYHIAEAGANPISQLAFTLANGFTFVEYYLSRGMNINEFGPNLSFFFSNGIDPEYAVIGRVARRIWAKTLKNKYGANERAQMLKYHIQTSGRSLHAQEIDFNDIRTTLQALYAIYDNCNSLHTNAYDEAITTPTEDSVRRAVAIQLIINKELGLAKNENPMQGSFIIEELTDLVEEAVMAEFDRINERGGVLGAMETMYQRGKIQEESLYYETLKHTGEYPIIGVNTFLSSKGSPTIIPNEVIRATTEEKEAQIETLQNLHNTYKEEAAAQLKNLQKVSIENHNIFEALMEATKVCSLGQITNALFEVGGQYRRNM
jgi:methylmalonyl-CoA mutase cobalamin-binding domain/chain